MPAKGVDLPESDTPSWGIEPVPDRLRVLGLLDGALLWTNLSVSLLVIVAGAFLVLPSSQFGLGLSLPVALGAIVAAAVVGNVLLGLGGLIGADARVPTMVLMRAPLGRRGSYLPTGLNIVQCLGWSVFELIIIATGAQYRKPSLDRLAQFEGAGIYYSATFMEAQVCSSEEVIVVGGGNSAGQAAVFLAQTSKHVHVLIRSGGLADTMSRYLSRRIEESPSISLRTHTEVIDLEGNGHLERVRVRDKTSGAVQALDIRHVFMMTGAVPNTIWLDGCIALDSKGFIKTGPDLTPDDLASAQWPLTRPPLLLETNRPGVFAVGDVRGGNVKRVASAVGEGSIAVSFVHRVLAE